MSDLLRLVYPVDRLPFLSMVQTRHPIRHDFVSVHVLTTGCRHRAPSSRKIEESDSEPHLSQHPLPGFACICREPLPVRRWRCRAAPLSCSLSPRLVGDLAGGRTASACTG